MAIRIAALALFIVFALHTGWAMAIAEQSLLAFGMQLLSRPDTAQLVVDLYLMAGMAGIWMARDARSRGGSWRSVLPYLPLTAVFVSLGPLLYIAVRGLGTEEGAAQRQ